MSSQTWHSVASIYGQSVHHSTSDGRDFAWFSEARQIAGGEWRVETGPVGSKRANDDPLGLASRTELPFVSRHKNQTISELQPLPPR